MEPNISQPPHPHHTGISKPVFILSLILAIILSSFGTYFLVSTTQTPVPAPQPLSNPVIEKSNPTPTKTTGKPTDDWELATFPSLKSETSSFTGFTIRFPAGWTAKLTESPSITTLNITNGDYKMGISQAPMGGNKCIYKGDEKEEGPVADYRDKEFTEVFTEIGKLRRIEILTPNGSNYASPLCQYFETNKYYGSPTSIGVIAYEFPLSFDPIMLVEMDQILMTIEKN